ncbi:MAG: histidine kinase [Flavobacteriales bacterium]|nr:histidine kinase [Flavobacteriales bacterium]
MLGEDQFRGVQIYDVIQDNLQNYWFSTNNGLYFYNGVNFEQIQCPDSKSISFFNLVVDSKGTIYCKNLNNQIFKLNNKKATLFHTLKKDEVNSDVKLLINGNDELMVFSKVIKLIDKKGKVKSQIHLENHYCGQPRLTKDKSVIAHLNDSDSLIQYQNGKFNYIKIRHKESYTSPPVTLNFYQNGQDLFAVDMIRKTTYLYQNKQLSIVTFKQKAQIHKTESVRIYETSKGLWIAGTLPGISLESYLYPDFPTSFYNSFFISDVYEDKEGNILLSTFDKGIMVIPDLLINDVIKIGNDAIVSCINSNDTSSIFAGTSKGEIYIKHNGNFKLLSNNGTRPINIVEKFPGNDWVITDNGYIRAINIHSGKTVDIYNASLKGVAFVDEHQFYIGTNIGVFHVSKQKDQFVVTPISGLNSRVYHLHFDKENKILYIATSDGLYVYSESKIRELKINNNSLFVSGMALDGQNLYISTRIHGITLIKNGKIISSQQYFYNKHHLTFKKILVQSSVLVAETSDGFYLIELVSKKIKALHFIYEFSNNRIIDFEMYNNQLWVSHSGGVQNINLNYKANTKTRSFVRIETIQINNNDVNYDNLQKLSHNQNKIQFTFSSNSLRNRGVLQYQFRLLGSDTTWQVNDFNQNSVTFNALSPGKYTFQIRVINQNYTSEIEEVQFRITPPLYLRWWFTVLTSIVFLGIVYFIYRWQLQRQREKLQRINELNSSKLTAIKSQMNPHFIFNSLNSIQDLILKGDVEHSYSYISTFSNMVRATLNNSEKEFIDVEQEIKLLELYLSLEKLRFKNDFEYEMIYDKNMNILIPPMLIQPFIENALVHGLLHKKGAKKISIRFQLNEVFECIVEDNGIGRKAALAIQSRQQRHESFSSKAIKKRFEILSHVYNGIFGFEYEDLEKDGQNMGTRVTMKMPYKDKF